MIKINSTKKNNAIKQKFNKNDKQQRATKIQSVFYEIGEDLILHHDLFLFVPN